MDVNMIPSALVVGTARCAVTARKAGGIQRYGTIQHPMMLVAPLDAARTASRSIGIPTRGSSLTIAIVLLLSACASHADTIDLSGKWDFRMGSSLTGPYTDTIYLPGTTSQAGKGTPFTLQPVLPILAPENFVSEKGLTFGRATNYASENVSLMHLQQRYSRIGPAWYRRDVDIPKSWAAKDVELVLERVIWKSQVWINGQYIGATNSLTTPHRYEIGAALKAGPQSNRHLRG